MAKFYPKTISNQNDIENHGEREVYQALSSLDDNYTIFHSFCWLDPGVGDQRRSEGEADFVVIHPRRGIIVIEVKAGGISYENGTWIQENRLSHERKNIDPLRQATNSQHILHRLLIPNYDNVLVGRAVWFTSVVLPKGMKLPADADRAIILDQEALDRPDKALAEAYNFWERTLGFSSATLSNDDFLNLIKELLPHFHIVETISSMSGGLQEAYVRLTRQQTAVLEFLREQRTTAIHGAAGTGKTLLAAEKAKMLAAEGEKVLYLCFNEFLLETMRNKIRNPLITLHNVRTLAEEILDDDSLAINEVIPFFEKCFAEDFNDANWQYPNIVVDEGQDISDSVLMHLSHLAEKAGGAFYVFYDRNQYIMTKKPEWIDKAVDCRLVLYKNCRNTAEIAASAGSVMQLDGRTYKSYLNELHGLPPKAVFYRDAAELKKIAADFVRTMVNQKFSPDKIVILAHNSVPKSLLNGITELSGVEISTVPKEGCVLFTSVRKYKGLDNEAVLITDVKLSGLANDLNRRILYVGESRATNFLQVAIADDVNRADYEKIISLFTNEPLTANRKNIAKALGLDTANT